SSAQKAEQLQQRQALHAVPVTADLRKELRSLSLGAVGADAGEQLRPPARQIVVEERVAEGTHPQLGPPDVAPDRCAGLTDHRGGEKLVAPAAQRAQLFGGLGQVAGLVEKPAFADE